MFISFSLLGWGPRVSNISDLFEKLRTPPWVFQSFILIFRYFWFFSTPPPLFQTLSCKFPFFLLWRLPLGFSRQLFPNQFCFLTLVPMRYAYSPVNHSKHSVVDKYLECSCTYFSDIYERAQKKINEIFLLGSDPSHQSPNPP